MMRFVLVYRDIVRMFDLVQYRKEVDEWKRVI